MCGEPVGGAPLAIPGGLGFLFGVQNRFTIEVAFVGVLGPFPGTKRDPTSRPRGVQEASETLLEQAWNGRRFSEASWGQFWVLFWALGTLKIVLPPRRGHVFC